MGFAGTEHALFGIIGTDKLELLRKRLESMNAVRRDLNEEHQLFQPKMSAPLTEGGGQKSTNFIRTVRVREEGQDEDQFNVVHLSPGDYALQERCLVTDIIEAAIIEGCPKEGSYFPQLIGYV